MSNHKGTIGILTGGGDVPGLNPAIRAVTFRAIREGYRVVGIRRGWAGLAEFIPDNNADNSDNVRELTEVLVDKVVRTGGTFLHTSRTLPSRLPLKAVPPHLKDQYTNEINDITPAVLKNLEFLGIDFLIAIGGDDTLSYAQRLHEEGVKVVAIPKTMDNDVPGTDYCIGFSTCITRTVELAHNLRTCAGSHESFLILEVFGRYAGFTAMLPTMAGAASRCLIPESPFNTEHLAELLSHDYKQNPSNYSLAIISEGAMMKEQDGMIFENEETDQFGHKRLGGIGEVVAAQLKKFAPKYNSGKQVHVMYQRLGYLARSGEPDATDSIVPMVYGNLAFDLVLNNDSGKLVNLRNGKYGNIEIDVVISKKKIVNVKKYYNTERLRPKYEDLFGNSTYIITCD
jgi:6-phosphofructokinase 1